MPKPTDSQLKCSILLKSSFYPILFSKKTDTYINYEEIFRIPLFFIRRKIVFLQKFDTDPL